jgi:hypothetical protein
MGFLVQSPRNINYFNVAPITTHKMCYKDESGMSCQGFELCDSSELKLFMIKS